MTQHALERASHHGRTAADIAETVLEHHPARRRNPGSADWKVTAGGTNVLYDWPDHGDSGTARVVTVWPAD